MSITMAALLSYDEQVPRAARDALMAAQDGPPNRRYLLLDSAARILHREGGVECTDALELVDLDTGACESECPEG